MSSPIAYTALTALLVLALALEWGPAALALASVLLGEGWLAAALAWGVYISLDRAIGYGLRTPEGFQRHAHAGRRA
jgi:hypothetical protein